MKLRLACVVLFLATAIGCGGKPVNLKPAAIASETFSVALKTTQAQFVAWGEAGVIDRATERRWQAAFRTAAEAGLAVDAAIRAGDHRSIVANANALAVLVETLIRDEVVRLSPNQRGIVQTALISLRGFIAIWQAVNPPQASVGSRVDLYAIAKGH